MGWKQWGAKGNTCFGPRGVTEFPWQTPSPGIWVTEDAERDRGALPVVQNTPPTPAGFFISFVNWEELWAHPTSFKAEGGEGMTS